MYEKILCKIIIAKQFGVISFIVSTFTNGNVGVVLGEFRRSGNVKKAKFKQGLLNISRFQKAAKVANHAVKTPITAH